MIDCSCYGIVQYTQVVFPEMPQLSQFVPTVFQYCRTPKQASQRYLQQFRNNQCNWTDVVIQYFIVQNVRKGRQNLSDGKIHRKLEYDYNPKFGRMSVTVSNWKQICDAPTNKSLSKMAFSFSKANRFSAQKQNKSQIFYSISTKINPRTTSFGYGNKYDFTKDQPKSPPPNSYNVSTVFENSPKISKGYCFGEGRDEMTLTGPLAQTINNKNPGPGAYEPIKKTGKIAYSLRGKIKSPQPQAQKIPGPGTYQQNNFFNHQGTIFNSKHANHKAIKFCASSERFKKLQSPFPGPGRYNTSTIDLSSSGKYSLSNLQNSKVRSFGHAVRQTFANRCQTPGPGNYTMPSEFGYYLNKKEYERTESRSPLGRTTQQAP